MANRFSQFGYEEPAGEPVVASNDESTTTKNRFEQYGGGNRYEEFNAPSPAPDKNPLSLDSYDFGDSNPEPVSEDGFFSNIAGLAGQSYDQTTANFSALLAAGRWDEIGADSQQELAETLAKAKKAHV